jgi:hypothetical protein
VIVISMLLVIVGAVTLVIGAFLRDDLFLVYVSIASCLAAGLFLVIGIIRSRPSRKPVLASGGDGQDASWSGASSWSGDGRDSGDAGAAAAGTQVLDRDEGTDEAQGVAAEEPAAAPVLPPDAPSEADDRWQPPPAAPEPAEAPPAGATAMDAPAPAATSDQPEQDVPAAAKVAKKATAKKSTPAAGLPAGFEVLSEVSGVGPAKQRAIAARFGTVEALRAADADELAEIPGISATLARRIHDHLQF